MFRNVKLFEAGNYTQGDFPLDKVKEIFSKTKDSVSAQFAHTSKIVKAGKEALGLGEFSNFGIDEAGVITADIEFNEDGKDLYDKGIINGCSVEINDGAISRVAILPVGVTPAITGAEFEETGSITFGSEMEFEELPVKLTVAELAQGIVGLDATGDMSEFGMIQEAVWEKSDQSYAVNKLKEAGYTVTLETSEFEGMSSAEIVQETTKKVNAVFAAKANGTKEFAKLKAEGKITPKMEEAGLTEEFMSMLENQEASTGTLEFGEQSFEFAKIFKNILKASDGLNMGSKIETNEFEKKDEKTGIKTSAEDVVAYLNAQ